MGADLVTNGALGRLAEWARSRLGDEFRWGETDCAILCLEAVDVMAGTTLAVRHRGRYRTAAQSLRYQRKVGMDLAGQIAGVAFAAHGTPRIGDILTHAHPERPWQVGHVCFGVLALTAHEAGGVDWVPTHSIFSMPNARTWRIA